MAGFIYIVILVFTTIFILPGIVVDVYESIGWYIIPVLLVIIFAIVYGVEYWKQKRKEENELAINEFHNWGNDISNQCTEISEEDIVSEEDGIIISEIQQRRDRIIYQLNDIIDSDFSITSCSRCGEVNYISLFANSVGTAINIECLSCQKKIWVKSDTHDNKDKIIDLYELYRKEYFNGMRMQVSANTVRDINIHKKESKRQSIPKIVKQEVWQRDSGKCVECGSNEKLEYDHIIPVSKGGANTTRNIQLLCEPCNRKKSAKIQ